MRCALQARKELLASFDLLAQPGRALGRFDPLNTKNVLYTPRTTVYCLNRAWQLSILMLSMKRRLPKLLLLVVAAARVPSEGAI